MNNLFFKRLGMKCNVFLVDRFLLNLCEGFLCIFNRNVGCFM